MWWHTRRNQISSFGETDESIEVGVGVKSVDYWQPSVSTSGSNAGYTMFRGSVKNTGCLLHSPVFPPLPLPCVTVCHHISTGLYLNATSSLTNAASLTEQYYCEIHVIYCILLIYIYMVGKTEIKITLRNVTVDGMVQLTLIKKLYGKAWTVLISLGTVTDCGLLWARWWTVGFHKERGLSWPSEEMLASQQACAPCRQSVTPVIVNTPTLVSVPFMVLLWILLAKYTVAWAKSDHCTWYWTTLHVVVDWLAGALLHIR
jgi:hypothetical protein